MVSYDFLKDGEDKIKMEPGRVEFLDVDLPEKTKGAVDLVRHKMIEGDQSISMMKKEADALAVKDDETFARASEMIGQTKNLKKYIKVKYNAWFFIDNDIDCLIIDLKIYFIQL